MSPAVLIVDDDAFVRAGLRGLLESADYQVREAGSRNGALQIAQAEPLTAAVIDISIPSEEGVRSWSMTTEGLALVRALKRQAPDLGVIVYSAYADHLEAVMELLGEGVRGLAYRLKGRRADDLLDLLVRVGQGQVEIDAEVNGARPDLGQALLERLSAEERPWVERALRGLGQLTPQESRAAQLLARSHSPSGVAEQLGIHRADGVIGRLYVKLGLDAVADVAPQLRAIGLLIKAYQIRELSGAQPGHEEP